MSSELRRTITIENGEDTRFELNLNTGNISLLTVADDDTVIGNLEIHPTALSDIVSEYKKRFVDMGNGKSEPLSVD